jgi:hypothetical protein
MSKLKRYSNLTIIIGNTDPYYIYSQSFTLYPNLSSELLWKRFDDRWKIYQRNLNKWLKDQGLRNFRLVSWREFEIQLNRSGLSFDRLFNLLLPKIDTYFSQSDFAWELRRLKLAFGPGQYFPTLKTPSDKILNQWIRRKFTEYMLQGFLLYLFFPNSILIQNEKPTTLRNKMYQPLITKLFNQKLPIICPFGIDDLGYQ